MNKKTTAPKAPDLITGGGLPAHLVARRCLTLPSAEERELVWFLQELSMRSGRNSHHACDKFKSWPWETPGFSGGGIERVAADLLNLFPEQIGTPSMCRAKKNRTGSYSSAEVKAIRSEIPHLRAADYRVKGEAIMEMHERDMNLEDAKRRAEFYPETYPVMTFMEMVERGLSNLPAFIKSLCLDTSLDLSTSRLWYVNDVMGVLRQYKRRFEAAVAGQIVETEITRSVHQTLKLALASRGMVLIEGNPREGKSKSSQFWCQQRLGRVRYVQLESSTDESSFFRQIARALGTPCNPELKAFEMRAYIQEALGSGDLLLVIDEADHLWPRTVRPIKAPARIEWVNTALKNRDIPVAMVGTTKFSECIHVFDTRCKVWASEQFKGRLADHLRLQGDLSSEDLRAIAQFFLPSASEGMVNLLAALAMKDEGYVATIERAVQKASFLADQRGEGKVTASILKEVCEEIMGRVPAGELAAPAALPKNSRCNAPAAPAQSPGRIIARRTSMAHAQVLEPAVTRQHSSVLME